MKYILHLLVVLAFAAPRAAAQSPVASPASPSSAVTTFDDYEDSAQTVDAGESPVAPSAISSDPGDVVASIGALPVAAPEGQAFLGPPRPIEAQGGFRWGRATSQSLLFLAVMHAFRMKEAKTRSKLGGPFWKDYFESVKGLRGWGDGGKQFTNYIGHPAQGAAMGRLWVDNDPKALFLEIGSSRAYWNSRSKALVWATVWSTMFEIGPISEASLGNVGQIPGRQAAVDLVITPTLGTVVLIGEDAIDRYVIRWFEGKSSNGPLRAFLRLSLNPARAVANMVQFKWPWYRAARPLGYAAAH